MTLTFEDDAMPLDPPAGTAAALSKDGSAAAFSLGAVRVVLLAISFERRDLQAHNLHRRKGGSPTELNVPDEPVAPVKSDRAADQSEKDSFAPEPDSLPFGHDLRLRYRGYGDLILLAEEAPQVGASSV